MKEIDAMKIHVKYQTALFCFFMSLFMSMAISFSLVLINNGLQREIFSIWLPKYALSFAIAFPVSLMVIPVVRRIVGRICL